MSNKTMPGCFKHAPGADGGCADCVEKVERLLQARIFTPNGDQLPLPPFIPVSWLPAPEPQLNVSGKEDYRKYATPEDVKWARDFIAEIEEDFANRDTLDELPVASLKYEAIRNRLGQARFEEIQKIVSKTEWPEP